jgi:predicted transcriptional regulator
MELKTARLTLLIDPEKKAAFEHLCARQDRTASQVVRQLIRDYLAEHDVAYRPAGLAQGDAGKLDRPRVPDTESKSVPRVASRPGSASRSGQRRR